MLELLRLPGMGPKTVALVWSALAVADIDALEDGRSGPATSIPCPAWAKNFVTKLLKGIEDHRKNSSRFRIDVARDTAQPNRRVDPRFSRASTPSPPPARCAAAARPSAISTCSRPALPANPTSSKPPSNTSPRSP